jgi:hypothetical protein
VSPETIASQNQTLIKHIIPLQAIEVRVGPAGVKAKWVRVELRKIETLPGGGVTNTFFDFVGQSPLNLWQAEGAEYNPLTTVSFSTAVSRLSD